MSAFIVPPKDEPAPKPTQPNTTTVTTGGLSLGAIAPWASTALLAAVLGWMLWTGRGGVGPTPDPGGIDPAFVAIGKTYAPKLGASYADAWEDGAKILSAGQPVDMALDTLAKTFETRRLEEFRASIKPELSKVLPEQTPEKEIAPEKRSALARAWRGLAKGLRGK